MTDEDAYGVLAAETCPECGKCVPQNRKPVCVQRTQSSIIDPQPSMPFTGQNTRTRSNGTPISSPVLVILLFSVGDCSTYAPFNENFDMCENDIDEYGIVAAEAC